MSPSPTQEVFADVPLIARDEIETPLGTMTALATEAGLAALLFDSDRYHQGPFDDVPLRPLHSHVAAARAWLDDYWHDGSEDLESPTLDLHGSLFQRTVWKVLLGIPTGRTMTYGQVAQQVGPGAMPRATGGAIGRNPVALIVPCHRVVGANGSLTGYASGLPRKTRLLQHEGVLLA